MHDFIQSLLPPSFQLWHLPVIFLAGLIGEGYGTVLGCGGILIQFILSSLGLPLQSVVATDLAGCLGSNLGVITASPKSIWANKKLIIILCIPLSLGGFLGTSLLASISDTALRYILIGGLMALLIHMLIKKRYETQVPTEVSITAKQYPLLFIVLFTLGVYGNVSGIGVGTFQKLAFVTLPRLSFANSLGINNIIGLPAALFSLIITAMSGLIVWPYLVVLWIGTFLGGNHVTRYVQIIPDTFLRRLLLLLTVLYLSYLIFKSAI